MGAPVLGWCCCRLVLCTCPQGVRASGIAHQPGGPDAPHLCDINICGTSLQPACDITGTNRCHSCGVTAHTEGGAGSWEALSGPQHTALAACEPSRPPALLAIEPPAETHFDPQGVCCWGCAPHQRYTARGAHRTHSHTLCLQVHGSSSRAYSHS